MGSSLYRASRWSVVEEEDDELKAVEGERGSVSVTDGRSCPSGKFIDSERIEAAR